MKDTIVGLIISIFAVSAFLFALIILIKIYEPQLNKFLWSIDRAADKVIELIKN